MITADDPMLEALHRFRIGRYRLPSRTREQYKTTPKAKASEAQQYMEEYGLQYLLVYEHEEDAMPIGILRRVNGKKERVSDCGWESIKGKPIYDWKESYIHVLHKTLKKPYILVSQKEHESFRYASSEDLQGDAEIELVELTDMFLDSHELRMLAYTLFGCLEYCLRDMVETTLKNSKKQIQNALKVSLDEKYYKDTFAYWQANRSRGSQKTLLECFYMQDIAQTLYTLEALSDAQASIIKQIRPTRNALAHSHVEIPDLLENTRNAYALLMQLLGSTVRDEVKRRYRLS